MDSQGCQSVVQQLQMEVEKLEQKANDIENQLYLGKQREREIEKQLMISNRQIKRRQSELIEDGLEFRQQLSYLVKTDKKLEQDRAHIDLEIKFEQLESGFDDARQAELEEQRDSINHQIKVGRQRIHEYEKKLKYIDSQINLDQVDLIGGQSHLLEEQKHQDELQVKLTKQLGNVKQELGHAMLQLESQTELQQQLRVEELVKEAEQSELAKQLEIEGSYESDKAAYATQFRQEQRDLRRQRNQQFELEELLKDFLYQSQAIQILEDEQQMELSCLENELSLLEFKVSLETPVHESEDAFEKETSAESLDTSVERSEDSVGNELVKESLETSAYKLKDSLQREISEDSLKTLVERLEESFDGKPIRESLEAPVSGQEDSLKDNQSEAPLETPVHGSGDALEIHPKESLEAPVLGSDNSYNNQQSEAPLETPVHGSEDALDIIPSEAPLETPVHESEDALDIIPSEAPLETPVHESEDALDINPSEAPLETPAHGSEDALDNDQSIEPLKSSVIKSTNVLEGSSSETLTESLNNAFDSKVTEQEPLFGKSEGFLAQALKDIIDSWDTQSEESVEAIYELSVSSRQPLLPLEAGSEHQHDPCQLAPICGSPESSIYQDAINSDSPKSISSIVRTFWHSMKSNWRKARAHASKRSQGDTKVHLKKRGQIFENYGISITMVSPIEQNDENLVRYVPLCTSEDGDSYRKGLRRKALNLMKHGPLMKMY